MQVPILLAPLAAELLPRLRLYKGFIAVLAESAFWYLPSSEASRSFFERERVANVMHVVKHKFDLTC